MTDTHVADEIPCPSCESSDWDWLTFQRWEDDDPKLDTHIPTPDIEEQRNRAVDRLMVCQECGTVCDSEVVADGE